MTDYPRIAGINYESVTDGSGIRLVIYLSGCNHDCSGCHNPETHDPNFGSQVTEEIIDSIANYINKNTVVGLTLSGGDPLYDPKATYKLLMLLNEKITRPTNVWLYTGYTWEHIWNHMYNNDQNIGLLLLMVDVVVDGPFIQELADKRLAFRGSSNQRIIDVWKSMTSNSIVELKEYT